MAEDQPPSHAPDGQSPHASSSLSLTPTSKLASATENETEAGRRDDHSGGGRGRGRRGGRGGGRGGFGKSNKEWDADTRKRRRGSGRGHRGAGTEQRDRHRDRDREREDREQKRRKVIDENGQSFASIQFAPEEIAAEERRPKRKVAMLIGYAGTGYYGLQINHHERTVEGELFSALIGVNAISKANADDPKKSALVRCARTDKGVHAACNVLSLKLIIEDEDLVKKLNESLPPQIRVWGIQQTTRGFTAYHACESRWYEYLMPSYALLPPHPESFLGKAVAESAKQKGVWEEFQERLGDLKDFWAEVQKKTVDPILNKLEPSVRAEVLQLLRLASDQEISSNRVSEDKVNTKEGSRVDEDVTPITAVAQDLAANMDISTNAHEKAATPSGGVLDAKATDTPQAPGEPRVMTPAEEAVRDVKAAIVAAKRRYRVSSEQMGRLQDALNQYLGTKNYHNFTEKKSFKDHSSKRYIMKFDLNPDPIQIGDTEWLSMKVHGQSFMLHQIRKMVAMAVMLVRCGSPLSTISDSYGPRRIIIPKAPSRGLLLERPEFPEYNKKAKGLDREPIDFSKWDKEIQAFKDKEIYSRVFETEEEKNDFVQFFHQLDHYRVEYFLWVTAGGVEAARERGATADDKIPEELKAQLGDEPDGVNEDGD